MKLILNKDYAKEININDYSRNFIYVNNHKTMSFTLNINDSTESQIIKLLTFKDSIIHHLTIISSEEEILYDFDIEKGILNSLLDRVIASTEQRIIVASITFESMTIGKI